MFGSLSGFAAHKGANYSSGHYFSAFRCHFHHDDGEIRAITDALEDEDLLRKIRIVWSVQVESENASAKPIVSLSVLLVRAVFDVDTLLL